MTVDLDALIAEARGVLLSGGPTWETDAAGYIADLADALESTLAELRQERERADAYRIMQRETAKTAREMRAESDAALSRAEETIERVRSADGTTSTWDDFGHQVLDILTEYSKQKEQA